MFVLHGLFHKVDEARSSTVCHLDIKLMCWCHHGQLPCCFINCPRLCSSQTALGSERVSIWGLLHLLTGKASWAPSSLLHWLQSNKHWCTTTFLLFRRLNVITWAHGYKNTMGSGDDWQHNLKKMLKNIQWEMSGLFRKHMPIRLLCYYFHEKYVVLDTKGIIVVGQIKCLSQRIMNCFTPFCLDLTKGAYSY